MSEQHTPPTVLERALGDTEPLRRALYPIAVALVALLVGYGVVDGEQAPLWLSLAVAVLMPGGIEVARRVVFAPATVYAEAHAWQAALTDRVDAEFARGVAVGQGFGDEPGEHAADRTPTQEFAVSRADRCREVEDGRRCRLRPHGGAPHKFD